MTLIRALHELLWNRDHGICGICHLLGKVMAVRVSGVRAAPGNPRRAA